MPAFDCNFELSRLEFSRAMSRDQVTCIVQKDPMYSSAHTVLGQLMAKSSKATPHEVVLVPISFKLTPAGLLYDGIEYWVIGSSGTSFAEKSHEATRINSPIEWC